MKREFISKKILKIEENVILELLSKGRLKAGKKLLSKITIFLKSQTQKDFLIDSIQIFQVVRKYLKNNNILVSIIPISPVENLEAIMEFEYLLSENDISLNLYLSHDNLLQIQEVDTCNYQEISTCPNPLLFDVMALNNYNKILDKTISIHLEKYDNQLLRIWNFIGDITGEGIIGYKTIQNYQEFNNTRYDLFTKYKIVNYPASTGIGMDFLPLITIAFSVPKSPHYQIIYLENNMQFNAFDYSNNVLVGENIEKKPPLFSRGLLLSDSENYQLFVSGTSSIIGEDSVDIKNYASATKSTIQNIQQVCNLEKLSLVLNQNLIQENLIFKYVRVYLKESKNFENVKSIVHASFPHAEITYVKSDICRKELLVEIEAYAEITNINY